MSEELANALATINILELIGQDTRLKRVAQSRSNGIEWAGSCPFCGGEDRFRVWPEHPSGKGRWWCGISGGNGCGRRGDVIDYLQERHKLTFQEALRALKLDNVALSGPESRGNVSKKACRPPQGLTSPDLKWQAAGQTFVIETQRVLWSKEGAGALAWLQGRGLSPETVRYANLGYNPRDRRQSRHDWGLNSGRDVWLPRGIVIPWQIHGVLWRVNIRRPAGEPKYYGPAGWRNALYGAHRLDAGLPVVLVEGEFDVLTVVQEAGDLVTSVATGSTGGSRRTPWIARLAQAPLVLVSFDAEEAGDKAATWWLRVLPNGQRWRPWWEDVSQMHQDGADLRWWVQGGLAL